MDAARLMAPEVVAQGFRFPLATLDPAFVGGRGQYQLRVGLALSFSDIYKGARVLTAAESDCAQQRVKTEIDELLPQLRDLGKLPALRRQLAFLESRRARWQQLVRMGEERLAVRAITFLDFHELQKRATQMERKMAQVRGEAERIDARALHRPPTTLAVLSREYLARNLTFERDAAHVRALNAWQLRLSGGIVPFQLTDRGTVTWPGLIDWFALIELRVSLGVFKGPGGYLQARADEVKTSRYELLSRMDDFRREAIAALDQAKRELEAVELQASSTVRARELVERSAAPGLAHTMSLLSLDEILFESERIYLRALVDELSAIVEAKGS